MKSKKTIFVLAIIGLFFLVSYSLFQVSRLRDFQFFGGLTYRINTTQKVVALTFDDAPSDFSDQVVDILAAKQVKATFYLIGQNIQNTPESAKYISENGHELGNHSYSHQRFLLKSPSFVHREISLTNDLIRQTGYTGPITFRPPYGKKLFVLPWYLNRHNIPTIMWDVEPDTFADRNPQALVEYTLANVKPGSIILLHPFCESVCQADRLALPLIIDELKSLGYQFVTVSYLLSLSSKP